MVTTSLNFSDDFKLVNFKVPNYLIQNFDNLVRFKRVSRTEARYVFLLDFFALAAFAWSLMVLIRVWLRRQ